MLANRQAGERRPTGVNWRCAFQPREPGCMVAMGIDRLGHSRPRPREDAAQIALPRAHPADHSIIAPEQLCGTDASRSRRKSLAVGGRLELANSSLDCIIVRDSFIASLVDVVYSLDLMYQTRQLNRHPLLDHFDWATI
jgi:hypothetical protein